MKQFTFKYQNNKGGLYVLLSLFGIPLMIILLSIVLLDIIPWSLWIIIPLGIGAVVYCMARFIRISREIDTLSVDHEGFTSEKHGRIRYEDIYSIPPYNFLQAPPPSMRIKLNNGKKLVWQFNPRNQKSAEDIATFIAFRDELLLNLEQNAQQSFLAKEEDIQKTKLQEKGSRLVEQLQVSKNRNYKYIAISLSAVSALLILARTCGSDIIQNKRKEEARSLTRAMLQIESDYEKNVQQAQRTAADYSLKFGAIVLFTNDPKASIEFVPEIGGNPYMPKIEAIGLRRIEDNEILEKYIKHPDSVDYHMAVINTSGKFFAVMNKSIFSQDDESSVPVYLTVYNPNEAFPPSNFRGSKDTAFRPIEFSSSIGLPVKGDFTNAILENMDYASVRAVLQKYKSTFFYMAVKEMDVSTKKFQKLKEMIISDFEKHGISTEPFLEQRFNTNAKH
ncbi:Uncharacterised protein [Chryseobacterium nakagawai]|uniref:Uncharacterized protein n=1 Tax=Chryseobacterium nakagawai TaxID=1241982 RepID=A0AAD0YRI5_CHRNA|nr:hypothetical protein [Chryseobacterium nakagawai]AZA93640.1 hypothetical protein EG343_25055 [Chryseobacterium nakagawai]VEH20345.1 Uncharacterised protein [Chryseobacterium nakagawai]